jgi:hypothetical protein
MITLNKNQPVSLNKDEPHHLSKSNFTQRTKQLGNTQVLIDESKLSVVSKKYLKFSNVYGFRPLVVHPTVTSCLPYQAAREKRQLMLNELYKEREEIISAITIDIKDKAKQECQNNIAHYKKLFDEESDSVKKQNFQSMIDAEKRHLKTLDTKQVTETNMLHPDLIAIDNRIERLKHAQLHINNSGKCQSCGVYLPDSMEKHIDFVTSETRLLCPFCHLTEHIDEAAELRAGYIGYMPNISQEQINLFTYCYFILKYILEIDDSYSEEIKEKLRAFAERPISPNLEDITYAKLYQEIKSIRNAMKSSGNALIGFFKHHANIDKEHLKNEYEEKNGEKIESNIEDYLVLENKKYEDRKFTFRSDSYYSYNIDNMNLPEFYAGIMIANGVSVHAPTSVEEKLNVITRLDGIRFVPSYSFFKPYLSSWQKILLTTGFEAMMANFFVAFEDLIALNADLAVEPKNQVEKAENESPKFTIGDAEQAEESLEQKETGVEVIEDSVQENPKVNNLQSRLESAVDEFKNEINQETSSEHITSNEDISSDYNDIVKEKMNSQHNEKELTDEDIEEDEEPEEPPADPDIYGSY